MPELPEVETVVRGLRRARLSGSIIRAAQVFWPRIVATPDVAAFCRRVAGQRIAGLARRGKYILLALAGGDTLLIHLRMTGRLAFAAPGTARSRHDHVILDLDDGRQLRFHDTRKFGRWALVSDLAPVLGRMGPEPLDPHFTAAMFAARLRAHHRMLKPLLLDQHVIAGLGNIYVDEALWHAQLHPCRRSDTLTHAHGRTLLEAIRVVLQRGIRAQGTTLGRGETNFYSVAGRRGRNQDGLQVFRRTGDACPRCGKAVTRFVVAQRSTHICPRCQRAPRR